MQIQLFTYEPGRFTEIFAQTFSKALWQYLSSPQTADLLIKASREGRPAIADILVFVETQWETELGSPDYPPEDVGVMVNNMIKQIMAQRGYSHAACGLCRGRFIKVSGVYQKNPNPLGE
jgi:hypothetical protein